MGRTEIARGEVMERRYWSGVAIGARDEAIAGKVSPESDGARTVHWYWMRESGNGIVYTHWKASGLPVERVLFAELRAEEYDRREPYARLAGNCDADGCINPWHFEFGRKSAWKMTIEEAIRRNYGAELFDSRRPDLGTVREAALGIYLQVLEGAFIGTAIREDGTVDVAKATRGEDSVYLHGGDIRVLAEVQKLLTCDELMGAAEAMKEMEELRAVSRTATGGDLRERIAKATGKPVEEVAPEVAPEGSGKPSIRPRARRRPR